MGKKYAFKTPPYKHQRQALRKLIDNGFGGALLMEPRTGKTKTAIDYLSILASAGKIDRCVIVCPARVLDVWVEQFHMHCPVLYSIQMWDKDGRKAGLRPVGGPYKLHVVLVNYDAFGVPGRKLASGRRSKTSGRFKNRKVLVDWIARKPAAMVLDESHKIKSPSGKVSNMIVSMRPAFKYRVILTGTPVTKAKRLFDIYMQWQFLNPTRFEDLPTVAEFKNEFGKWTNRNGFPQFLGPRNVEDLTAAIHEDAYSITRAECFDLPPRTDVVVPLTLSARSGRVYDELAEEMVAQLESEAEGDDSKFVEAQIALTLTLRLSQITGGFAKTSIESGSETIQVGREKLDALEPLLEDAIENGEKVVVCARFRADLDAIAALCNRLHIPNWSLRGGIARQQVTQNITEFREHDDVGVFIMNPAAGGLGIDLSTAAHMVWYSLTPSWVDFTQACDRIALSEKATTFTFLLIDQTVDTVLYDTLLSDGDIGKAILKDPRKVLRT